MIFRFLNIQGIAGIAVSVALGILLVVQKAETRHWRKQSASFEQLYRQDRESFASTVANYHLAAVQARAADQANAQRVAADQRNISERTEHDFETRLAAARADAQRLRISAQAATNPGALRSPPMPGLSGGTRSAAEAAGQDGLPPADALIATEQAIQLDELIKWVREQAKVDTNTKP